MAARSTSIGIAVALTVLSLLTLTLFIFTTVFFGRYKEKDRQVQQMQGDATDLVRADERNRDDIRTLMQVAKDSRKSLVGYLAESQGEIMERVTGARRDTVTDLQNKVSAIPGAENGTLLSALNSAMARISTLESQLAAAETARASAVADLANESARFNTAAETHRQTIERLTSDIKAYQAEHEAYVAANEKYKQGVDQMLSKAKDEFAEKEKRLADQLTSQTESVLILEQQVRAARGQKSATSFRGDDEAALVDGEVIGAETSDKRIYINRGRAHKIALGMTFSVYSDKNAILPDPDGNYPAGKATIEVISVNETNSIARITSQARGNPVVRGDVIANAVYDPNKVYKFLVMGSFDVNRDGIATELERQDIVSLIESWGGEITDDLTGDVDFVVAGDRPVLRPQPGADASLEDTLSFEQSKQKLDRFEALFKQAASTSVPTLSENRLYTLIGKTPMPIRR
jgi:hypothetical protein